MSKTTRLGLPLEPLDCAQPAHVHNALVNWIEAGYTEFVKETMAAAMTIPSGYQFIIDGAYTIESDLTLEGTLVVL